VDQSQVKCNNPRCRRGAVYLFVAGPLCNGCSTIGKDLPPLIVDAKNRIPSGLPAAQIGGSLGSETKKASQFAAFFENHTVFFVDKAHPWCWAKVELPSKTFWTEFPLDETSS
jgi:hypothetical protein